MALQRCTAFLVLLGFQVDSSGVVPVTTQLSKGYGNFIGLEHLEDPYRVSTGSVQKRVGRGAGVHQHPALQGGSDAVPAALLHLRAIGARHALQPGAPVFSNRRIALLCTSILGAYVSVYGGDEYRFVKAITHA